MNDVVNPDDAEYIPAKRPPHRPSDYTPEKAEIICNQLADGIPLAEICRQPDMPNPSTVYRWMKNNPELSQAIASAREDGEERIAVDIRNVARGLPDYSTGDVYRDKLIIETDLKLLAKWNPKKYGDIHTHKETTNNTLVIANQEQARTAAKNILDSMLSNAQQLLVDDSNKEAGMIDITPSDT